MDSTLDRPHTIALPHPSSHDLERIALVQKHVGFFAKIPEITFVCIVNSVSFYRSREDSDIDLFIGCAPERCTYVRVLLNTYFALHGLLRSKKNEAKKICLSFFTAEYDISSIALKTRADIDDPYLVAWVRHAKCIYQRDDAFIHFLQSNTHWVDSIDLAISFRYVIVPVRAKRIPAFGKIDGLLFWLYIEIFRRFFAAHAQQPWGVILRRNMHKLHPEDRRWRESESHN